MAQYRRQFVRTNQYDHSFTISGLQDGPTTIARDANRSITVEVAPEVISQAWFNWLIDGQLIQNAFHMLTPADREFIKTGITPVQWAEMFEPREA